ncbi:MAG: asparaginase [Rubrobacter sp.]|nr:asparaginase [Rubrobacter sp.]
MNNAPPETGLPEDAPLAAARRGAMVESVHRGRIVFCDPTGEVLEAIGDPDGYVYARSAAKPFQALPLVLSGAADAFGLTTEELAVACASHNGEEPHLAAVRSILEKVGLSEHDLQNGAHPPFYPPEAAKLARSGEEPLPIHGNCSGKHAGMLAVCVHEGYDTLTYREPGHPLQRRIVALLAEACGLEEDEVLISGDNCGVPTFAVPLRSLATGFARIATGERLRDETGQAALRIRDAMRGHPFMVGGANRLDTDLMGATNLVTKVGAEAALAVGSPEGWGMALKISDGADRALRPAAVAALDRRGVKALRDDEPNVYPTHGLHGEVVGEIAPLL